MPTGRPGGIGSDIVASPDDDDDTPEPPDTPQPQDPNAPRPPGNVPGQLIGARDNYPNSHLDNPRNPFYQTAAAPIIGKGVPALITAPLGKLALCRISASAITTSTIWMPGWLRTSIAQSRTWSGQVFRNSLVVTSAYRPATRAEAAERGMDERTSQESVYARGHAPGGVHFPAGRPGGSNHGPGRALDFARLSGRALTWLRANAGRFGLETSDTGTAGSTTCLTSNCRAAGAAPPARDRARRSKRNNGPLMRKTGKRRLIALPGGGRRQRSKRGPQHLPAAGAGLAATPLATRGCPARPACRYAPAARAGSVATVAIFHGVPPPAVVQQSDIVQPPEAPVALPPQEAAPSPVAPRRRPIFRPRPRSCRRLHAGARTPCCRRAKRWTSSSKPQQN